MLSSCRDGVGSFWIKSYGCQMNMYDAERMADLLISDGLVEADDYDYADVVVLNTCHIREKAEDKVFSDIGRIKKTSNAIIILAGCVAQAYGDGVNQITKSVDIVIGPQQIHELPKLLKTFFEKKQKVNAIDFVGIDKFVELEDIKHHNVKVSEYVAIQEGCNKFCTYCVVPYTRGPEYSRNPVELINEINSLVDSGAKEIYLLGQNVNNYSYKNTTFTDLLYMVGEIKGIERIRYTTSHPMAMSQEIMLAHKNIKKLMPYLHLPVQSGSNEILKKMNRGYTREHYINIISELREYVPNIALSSDFIVGFPGETDKDFQDTMDMVEQVFYAQAYSFKYSIRPGTPAANMLDQVEESVKSERLAILQKKLNEQQDEYNKKSVGKTYKVLFEKSGKYEGQLNGRNEYYQMVTVEDCIDSMMDTIQDVIIHEVMSHTIKGRILSDSIISVI